jgi:hypothetical protein
MMGNGASSTDGGMAEMLLRMMSTTVLCGMGTSLWFPRCFVVSFLLWGVGGK